METLSTLPDTLAGIVSPTYYANGALKSCRLDEENRIETPFGEIVPLYREAEFGERQKKHRAALVFFENGEIKSAALDEQLPIQTPLGTIPAELVTFHENGAINRIFPLNGKIDGFWSEQNERQMAEPLDLDLSAGKIRAKIISLCFYPSGALRSVTLWPGERVVVDSPAGPILARTGFSLHEDGSLRSFEPARPVDLPTPIGTICAFDPEVIGMHADQNSVQFDPDGTLTAIKTVHTGVRIAGKDGETLVEPYEIPSFLDPSQLMTVPIGIAFASDRHVFSAKEVLSFCTAEHRFATFDRGRVLRARCAGCTGGEDCCSGDGGDCEN